MKKYILVPLILFFLLCTLNILRIYIEFNTYTTFKNDTNKAELYSIINDMQKVSDSLFDNIINTPKVLNIFQKAYNANSLEQGFVRVELYNELIENYKNFTKYGIQQLHFHLPNNDSFLRFHKPEKFGDNLTKVRESVAYVNKNKKAISGFEEGKIFNGYRFVYPLFSLHGEHIGSVEISTSLLTFKKAYEKAWKKHVDFVLHKSVVEKKLFASEIKNYESYHNLDDFLIQSTLAESNRKDEHNDLIHIFFEDPKVKYSIETIGNYTFSKIIDGKIYTLNLIPLHNHFLGTKVGYKIFFTESDYIKYFYYSVFGSFGTLGLFSILVGYLIRLNQKSTSYKIQKQKSEIRSEKLFASNQLIKSVLNGTTDLIFYKDAFFTYLGCNEAFAESLGKTKKEIIGKNDFELFDDKFATVLRNTENIALKKKEVISHYEWRTFANGEEIYLDTKIIPFHYDDDESMVGILGISRDMTELYKMQQDLRNQTLTDELTKILNRKAYNARVAEMLVNFKRYETPFCIVMFDVDHFKSINDTYGHKIGDLVLIELCTLVTSKIRENDYFFRIGGEEFIVLLNQTTLEGGVKFAGNIRELVEKNLSIIEGRVITISLGVTDAQNEDTADGIFKRVDSYLYEAKQSGRNKVCSAII